MDNEEFQKAVLEQLHSLKLEQETLEQKHDNLLQGQLRLEKDVKTLKKDAKDINLWTK